jgi:hypothetical protein
MPPRRLDDRIRELCAKVVAAQETDLEPSISELKAALREHAARLRKLVARKFADSEGRVRERRSRKERRCDPASRI